MAWHSWFTGGSETASKVVDAGISGIDKMFYTDEEKADAAQKLGEIWLETQKQLLSESTVRSVTRRWLAWGIMGSYLLTNMLAVIAHLLGYDEIGAALQEIAASRYGTLAIVVAGFYFGPHMIQRMLNR